MKLMTEWAGGAHPQELYFSITVDSSQQWTLQSSLTPVPSYSLLRRVSWQGGDTRTHSLPYFPILPPSFLASRKVSDGSETPALCPHLWTSGELRWHSGFFPPYYPSVWGMTDVHFEDSHGTSRCSQTCSWPLGSRYTFQVEISESPLSAAWGWLAGWRVLNLVFKLHNALELQEQRFSNLGVNSEHSSESNQPEFSFSAGLSLKLSLLMIGCLALVNVMDLISWNWFSHKEYTWEK